MSVGLAAAGGNPGVVSCTDVKSIFEGRGVKTALDILEEPITGMCLYLINISTPTATVILLN